MVILLLTCRYPEGGSHHLIDQRDGLCARTTPALLFLTGSYFLHPGLPTFLSVAIGSLHIRPGLSPSDSG